MRRYSIFKKMAGETEDISDIRRIVRSFKVQNITIVSFVAGAIIASLCLAIFNSLEASVFILLMAGLLPTAIAYSIISSYDNDIEARAPEFFYDLSEQIKAGGTIVKALKRVSRQNYGAMSDEISRVISEIEHEGYDIAASLDSMAARVENKYISRSVSVIKEALTSSSNLDSILKIVSEEGRMSISLDRERRAGISSSIFVIYFTALILLGVLSLCLTSFIPMAQKISASTFAEGSSIHDILIPYYLLSMSVALCSGLTAGMMRNNSVFGGAFDAAFLVCVTFAVYSLVIFPGHTFLGAYGL